MTKIFSILLLLGSLSAWGQSSMRRCTLLPITDSVGGAVGFKVFEEVEKELRTSNWCNYVSNSSMMGVFSRYRENLAQHLKNKEVLKTVADKLKVGSIIRVGIINEVDGVEVQMDVYGDNGDDLYFSDAAALGTQDVKEIAETVSSWLNLYAKSIPYDGVVTGVLGDQVTMEVAKSVVVKPGQNFEVLRLTQKKKHPLLKKIVDWDTNRLALGTVQNYSDTQVAGQMKTYRTNQKLLVGDWVKMQSLPEGPIEDPSLDKKKEEEPGKLGILSLALFGTSSSVDTATPAGSKGINGNLFGLDFRVEGWITRQYFAALEVIRYLGKLEESSGNPEKDSVNINNGT